MPKRKTHKGGQKVRYDLLEKKGAICVHLNDCAASVFYALGYTDYETSIYLAQHSTGGLYGKSEVLPLLKLAYGDISWEELTPDSLNNNDATLALFSYGKTAHYIAVFKQNNTLFAFDPQLQRIEPLETYLQTFENVRGIYFINSNLRERGDNLVTREIIDEVFSPDLSLG